jgi:hypothetical protein
MLVFLVNTMDFIIPSDAKDGDYYIAQRSGNFQGLPFFAGDKLVITTNRTHVLIVPSGQALDLSTIQQDVSGLQQAQAATDSRLDTLEQLDTTPYTEGAGIKIVGTEIRLSISTLSTI